MVSVVKADIVGSRRVSNPEQWLLPLKEWLLVNVGETPENWELFWGDSLQLRVLNPAQVVRQCVLLKAFIRSLFLGVSGEKPLDIRMGIGLGTENYHATRISESNGDSYIYANESFETLTKEKQLFRFRSPWPELDARLNLSLQLAAVFMNSWTAASAEIVFTVLQNPAMGQEDLGARLGIKQNSVSDRWQRAHLTELLAMLEATEKDIQSYLP